MLLESRGLSLVEETDDKPKGADQRWQRWNARRLRRKQRNSRYYAHKKRRLKQTAFWGYAGLVEACIARRHALGWTQLELDERAGFQSGYSAKLENWRGRQGRVAGSVTMELWLTALGIGLIPVARIDGKLGDQLANLNVIRPKIPLADHNRRIPREGK